MTVCMQRRRGSLLTFSVAVAVTAHRASMVSAAACPAGGGGDPPAPTCSNYAYHKISDEFNGLASSCAAVEQTADPVLSLTQHECQVACDALEGCDTINFRWRDPNFDGESTCYRKKCGDFNVAGCTLFSKHKERDVYTKACGSSALWEDASVGNVFAGVECPEFPTAERVKVLGECKNGTYVEPTREICSSRYFKLSGEFNGLSSSCSSSVIPIVDSEPEPESDPLLGLDQSECQASCDALGQDVCDTIEFRWKDPQQGGQSSCYRKLCDDFEEAACSLENAGHARDVFTKACGAETQWKASVIPDANTGLFAASACPRQIERPQDITCDPADKAAQEALESVCTETRYYKIADESNGLATSCAAVDQTADPVIGLDQARCQKACDDMDGCDTINFRWVDPNFDGQTTCYRKNCGDFATAACTLFTKHKSRDVYTKACGAKALHAQHVLKDTNGLFAAVTCPDADDSNVTAAISACASSATTSCTARYYKVSDEANGVATSCAAVEQTADPVFGLDQAGCQAACDALDGCDTINFRWSDPNFDSQTTCYRKNCGTFVEAVGTLFSKHKERDVFTKACGSEELWKENVLTDADGLFAGVKVPGSDKQDGECDAWLSTNRSNTECDVCSSRSSSADTNAGGAASVRTCLTWTREKTGISSCKEYAPSALQIQQKAQYNEYLQSRWSEVGVCGGNYIKGTVCAIPRTDPVTGQEIVTIDPGTGEPVTETCEVRDQPCHGGTELGGVAGVLSAGWQMTFGTDEDNHVCTMCGRGTYGSCDEACAYRRNFFWSGYNLGSIEVELDAGQVMALYEAFKAAQPEEAYEVPQTLELKKDGAVLALLDALPYDHPVRSSQLPSNSPYSVISVDEVMVTERDQLDLISVGLVNTMASNPSAVAKTILSTSGVKVYETCRCFKCPRGQFQDGLGETRCKSCQDILPGSDTSDTGADGPQLCRCLTEVNDNFLNHDGTRCVPCDDVRKGLTAGPPGVCAIEGTDFADSFVVPAGRVLAPATPEPTSVPSPEPTPVPTNTPTTKAPATPAPTRAPATPGPTPAPTLPPTAAPTDEPVSSAPTLGPTATVLTTTASPNSTQGEEEDTGNNTRALLAEFHGDDAVGAARALQSEEASNAATATYNAIATSDESTPAFGSVPSDWVIFAPCAPVRNGDAAAPPGACGVEGTPEEDSYPIPATGAGILAFAANAASASAADDETFGGGKGDVIMAVAVPPEWTTFASCDAVRNGTAAAPPNACRCDVDTYETNAREAGVTDEPVADVPATWITCVVCPGGSSTFNDATKRYDYGSSKDSCYCQPGDYKSGGEGACATCRTLQTSPWNSQSSSDCKLTDAALLMVIVIPAGVIIFSLLLWLLNRRYSKKIRKLEIERRRQMQEKVNEATEIVNNLAHPMVFLKAKDFLECKKMVKHEEARANQVLITVDTMEELKGFKKTNTLIFFSHQWLAWANPDPARVQYNSMVSALHELVATKKLDLDRTFVWLDYTSIPQTHRGLQRLSINSLTNYAGACDYLIVVAPGETIHADTGTLCDKKSYQDRAWCRAEQLAHGCRKGVDNMYLTADGGGLEPVTWDWIKQSFNIFNGQLTCCARGHDGMEQCDREYLVTPVLGLYCELRALEKVALLPPEKKEILDFFRDNEEEVFPKLMQFNKGVGVKPEERELFGDILELLDELDLKEEGHLGGDGDSSSVGSSNQKSKADSFRRQSLSKKSGSKSSKKKRNSSKLGFEIEIDGDEWLDDETSRSQGRAGVSFRKKTPSERNMNMDDSNRSQKRSDEERRSATAQSVEQAKEAVKQDQVMHEEVDTSDSSGEPPKASDMV